MVNILLRLNVLVGAFVSEQFTEMVYFVLGIKQHTKYLLTDDFVAYTN
jgi:hypothetical protein